MRKNQWYTKMRITKSIINWTFLGLFMMCLINLLFMHYLFFFTISLESPYLYTSCFDNLIACLLDLTIVLGIVWLLSLRRLRTSLAITFIITLIWSFCNVLYSRFFNQYILKSALGQVGNLTDDFMIDSMLAGIKPIDLYFPLMAIVFCFIYFKTRHADIKTKSLNTIGLIWFIAFVMASAVHVSYFIHPNKTIKGVLGQTVFKSSKLDAMWPNWTVFHRGSLRTLFLDHLFDGRITELTKEQEKEIDDIINDHHLRVTGRTAPDNVKNIIFILVESYLSVSSDLVVDGHEITPNLNRLKHDSTVFYNGHMRPNVAIGESSDGQLIYMAGLLPLHSEITVTQTKNNEIIGLPELMKKSDPNCTSYTLIPTNPTLWEQQGMSEAYGFENLYSTLDYHEVMKDFKNGDYLDDDKIFSYASSIDQTISSPYMSLILTFSMHQPYTSCVEHGFHLTDKNLPQNYKNYLTSCHFTDIQIGKYIDFLKEKGIYDNSLIIIAADHDARPQYINMEGIVKPEIPLYIINGGINNATAWDGECNQLDVYTTILDVMGIDSKWRGLGHTLLNKDYQNSVTEKTHEISSLIINSDYFRGKDL